MNISLLPCIRSHSLWGTATVVEQLFGLLLPECLASTLKLIFVCCRNICCTYVSDLELIIFQTTLSCFVGGRVPRRYYIFRIKIRSFVFCMLRYAWVVSVYRLLPVTRGSGILKLRNICVVFSAFYRQASIIRLIRGRLSFSLFMWS